jgi:hypothetical protein
VELIWVPKCRFFFQRFYTLTLLLVVFGAKGVVFVFFEETPFLALFGLGALFVVAPEDY